MIFYNSVVLLFYQYKCKDCSPLPTHKKKEIPSNFAGLCDLIMSQV